jgi:Fur family ferric uptake transcriptional regulator
LHCTQCNAVVEFRNDAIRQLRETISLEHGFRAESHRFLITGVCPACARARSSRRRLDLI